MIVTFLGVSDSRTDELQRSAGGGRGRGVAVRHAAADAGGGGVAGVGGQPGQVGGAARVRG